MQRFSVNLSVLFVFIITLLLQSNVWAKARLYVKTSPSNSIITIWNIKQKFKQGIRLPAGNYNVQVHKAGYQAYRKNIYIGKNNKHLNIRLHRKQSKSSRVHVQKSQPLYVHVQNVPLAMVKIQILNINPKFKQGILLKAGKYKIKISAAGYVDYRKTVEVGNHSVNLEMNLTAEQANFDNQYKGNTDESLTSDQYPVYISVVPEDATIKLLNIKPRFYQGILLSSGKYLLEVSKKGYQKNKQWFEIDNNFNYVNVVLKQKGAVGKQYIKKSHSVKKRTYQLNISTYPVNAQVYILNTQQIYYPKMHLKSGRYLLQISHPLYNVYQQWVEISDADVHFEIHL